MTKKDLIAQPGRGILRRDFLKASGLLGAAALVPPGLERLVGRAEAAITELGLKDYAPPGFNFGVVLNNFGEWWGLTDWDQYLGSAAREFNYVVNNAFYLGIQKQTRNSNLDFSVPDEIMQFAADNNMKVRGNPLFTPYYIPDWFENLSREEVINEFLTYVNAVISRYKDWTCANGEKLVNAWICTNEVFYNDWNSTSLRNDGLFWSKFGDDDLARMEFIRDVYITARESDPNAKLTFSEINIQYNNWPHTQAVQNLIRWILQHGDYVDTVGIQSHRTTDDIRILGDFSEFAQNIQSFGEIGLCSEVTEADVSFFACDDTTLDDQAAVYAIILQRCLENLGLATGWSTWGHTDKYHWIRPCGEEPPDWRFDGAPSSICHCPTKPGSAILDENYNPKPAYYALRDTLIAAREAAAPAVRAFASKMYGAFLDVSPSEREATQLTRLLQGGSLTAAQFIHALSKDPCSATYGLSPMDYVMEVYQRVIGKDPMSAGPQTMRNLLTEGQLTKEIYVNNLTASKQFKDQTKNLWMSPN